MRRVVDRLLRRHPVLLAALVAVGIAGVVAARVVGEVAEPRPDCDDPVVWDRAAELVGRDAAVAGPVAAVVLAEGVGGQPTFLNLGHPHPDPRRFDVVVYADVREGFDTPLEALEGEDICVLGAVRERDGVPQIILDVPLQLRDAGGDPVEQR